MLAVADAKRRIPIENIDFHGRRLRDPAALCESGLQSFQARFRQPSIGASADVRAARDECLRATQQGGYQLPAHAQNRLSFDEIITTAHVRQAIKSMPRYKTPGEDGFPCDFYRCYAKELAPILAGAYRECMQDGRLTPGMRCSVITPIYKHKGSRLSWSNYRPITVSSAEYRILAKAVALRLNEVLQFLISPAQLGFQQDKYIGECTAAAQLLAARCARENVPGLMLLVDGDQAYDRVQWDWLHEVLMKMNMPASFCALIRMLYTDPCLSLKVNGTCSRSFCPLNGVKQGCPLSPLLYILSLQPFLALLEADNRSTTAGTLQGISTPGPHGRGMARLVHLTYADDLLILPHDASHMSRLERLLTLCTLACGAKIPLLC